jgi:hypothetical protein
MGALGQEDDEVLPHPVMLNPARAAIQGNVRRMGPG